MVTHPVWCGGQSIPSSGLRVHTPCPVDKTLFMGPRMVREKHASLGKPLVWLSVTSSTLDVKLSALGQDFLSFG